MVKPSTYIKHQATKNGENEAVQLKYNEILFCLSNEQENYYWGFHKQTKMEEKLRFEENENVIVP